MIYEIIFYPFRRELPEIKNFLNLTTKLHKTIDNK